MARNPSGPCLSHSLSRSRQRMLVPKRKAAPLNEPKDETLDDDGYEVLNANGWSGMARCGRAQPLPHGPPPRIPPGVGIMLNRGPPPPFLQLGDSSWIGTTGQANGTPDDDDNKVLSANCTTPNEVSNANLTREDSREGVWDDDEVLNADGTPNEVSNANGTPYDDEVLNADGTPNEVSNTNGTPYDDEVLNADGTPTSIADVVAAMDEERNVPLGRKRQLECSWYQGWWLPTPPPDPRDL